MRNVFIIFICAFLFCGCAKDDGDLAKFFEEMNKSTPETIAPIIATKAETKTEAAVPVALEEGQMSNPFLTEEEELMLSDKAERIVIDYLMLSAIIYSPPASKAIINGQILTVGGKVDNKKISDILPEAVFLKDNQSEYILSLKSPR